MLVPNNLAGHPERVANAQVALQLSRASAVRAAGLIGCSEDVRRVMGLAFTGARRWDAGCSVEVWDQAFGVMAAAWDGEIAPAERDRAMETLWAHIRGDLDQISGEGDPKEFFVKVYFFGLSVAAVAAVESALAEHLAARRLNAGPEATGQEGNEVARQQDKPDQSREPLTRPRACQGEA